MGVTLLCHGEYMMMRAQEFLKLKSVDFNYYPVPSTSVNMKIDVRPERHNIPVILFFGVIRYDKGLDILVSALKEILDLDRNEYRRIIKKKKTTKSLGNSSHF